MVINSLNLPLIDIEPSATLAINEKSAALVKQGRKVYRFGFGQSPFPVPQIVQDELKKHTHEKSYLPVLGLPQLREAVAKFHHKADGLDVDTEQVIIGPGSKELIYDVLLAVPSRVFVPAPAWVSYAPQAKLINRPVERIMTTLENNWRVTPELLDDTFSKYKDGVQPIIILNYPGNPDGLSYSEQDMKGMTEIFRKHNVLVISDEIYGRIHHTDRHRSLAHYYPEGTIITGGLSKWCGAGGWRLGTMVLPKGLDELRTVISGIISETFSAVSAPIQFAAIKAFEFSNEIQSYLAHSQRIMKLAGAFTYIKLKEAGANVQEPEGGFYLFPDFSPFKASLQAKGVTTNTELCNRLLDDTGVALLAGIWFGRDDACLTARLSYVDFDGDNALQASMAIGLDTELTVDFLKTHCPKVVDGVNALCEWLNS